MSDNRRDLIDIHRFATQRQEYENGVFWRRVSAVLLTNSLLLAGFGLLEEYSTAQVLIAVIGICSVAAWAHSAWWSWRADRYWRERAREVEAQWSVAQARIWTEWEHSVARWLRWLKPGALFAGPVGALFLAIWVLLLCNV